MFSIERNVHQRWTVGRNWRPEFWQLFRSLSQLAKCSMTIFWRDKIGFIFVCIHFAEIASAGIHRGSIEFSWRRTIIRQGKCRTNDRDRSRRVDDRAILCGCLLLLFFLEKGVNLSSRSERSSWSRCRGDRSSATGLAKHSEVLNAPPWFSPFISE